MISGLRGCQQRPPNTNARRAQISGGLIKVMAKRGYDGASVNEIAKAAELTPGLIHYHFKNKQEILLAALADLVARHEERLDESTEGSLQHVGQGRARSATDGATHLTSPISAHLSLVLSSVVASSPRLAVFSSPRLAVVAAVLAVRPGRAMSPMSPHATTMAPRIDVAMAAAHRVASSDPATPPIDVAPALVNPGAGVPVDARPRSSRVAAPAPGVAAAVPKPMAGDPERVGIRGRRDRLVERGRRSLTDHDLAPSCFVADNIGARASRQARREHQSQESAFE